MNEFISIVTNPLDTVIWIGNESSSETELLITSSPTSIRQTLCTHLNKGSSILNFWYGLHRTHRGGQGAIDRRCTSIGYGLWYLRDMRTASKDDVCGVATIVSWSITQFSVTVLKRAVDTWSAACTLLSYFEQLNTFLIQSFLTEFALTTRIGNRKG